MKCVKNLKTGEITRVTDERADSMTKNKEQFWFAPRSEWKAQVRKPKPVPTDENLKKAMADMSMKNIAMALDKEGRKKFPANVEGSKEFNEANAQSLKENKKKFAKGKK